MIRGPAKEECSSAGGMQRPISLEYQISPSPIPFDILVTGIGQTSFSIARNSAQTPLITARQTVSTQQLFGWAAKEIKKKLTYDEFSTLVQTFIVHQYEFENVVWGLLKSPLSTDEYLY